MTVVFPSIRMDFRFRSSMALKQEVGGYPDILGPTVHEVWLL